MSILWTGEPRSVPTKPGKPSRRRLLTGLFTLAALCGLLTIGVQTQALAGAAPTITGSDGPVILSPNGMYSIRVYISNSQAGYCLRLNDQDITNGNIIGGSVCLQGTESYVDIQFSTGQNRGCGSVDLPIELWDSDFVTYHGNHLGQALWAI